MKYEIKRRVSIEMSVRVLTVDGNIGSGKSTLLEILKKRYHGSETVLFAPEPVDQWEKIKDKNNVTILEKFYQDQPTYSFSFQMMAYISRLAILRRMVRENKGKSIIIITERSLLTDKMVFARMLYDQGKIKEVDYQIYLQWFHEFADDFPLSHCIYIKADPRICHQRIGERSRQGESSIPLDYLETCDHYHKDYIRTLPCLELNGNENIKTHPEILETWISAINQLISP